MTLALQIILSIIVGAGLLAAVVTYIRNDT